MDLEIPELLYHGSYYDFSEFDDRFKRSSTGWENTLHGFFFADKPENALLFGPKVYTAEVSISKPLDLRIHGIFSTLEQAPVLCEVIFERTLNPRAALSLLNREIDLGEIADMYDALNTEEANLAFRKAGYDGIVSDLGDYQNEYIAFNTSQIRILDVLNFGKERHLSEVESRRR
ncbi:ADP-ribosyltransferase-containing protein [Pedobacter sp. GR22-6]|uniref:ADP-ribosyltransferase-containing protein n=1 Tax=Pedobacter sp. GR22-6 TaxID=3127957 RepID=UPI00307FC907